MTEYTPDSWCLLKIKPGKLDPPFYKVLATWNGGYLHGDAWRINSGITLMEDDGDYYNFYGESGSLYRCHKEGQHVSSIAASVYRSLKEKEAFEGQIELVEDFKIE